MPSSTQETLAPGIPKGDLIKEFGTFLPPEAILSEEEDLSPYECDGLSAYRALPWLAVLPETVEQAQKILQICHAWDIPVVARGAGTGLSGGALPLQNGVLLSLAKFNKILAIDPINRTARVQPGVRNLAISEAAEPDGLYYAPDPSSQIACTIGGNVAENSGGVHCLKYGLTVHNILALKILTMDGEQISLGGETLDSPGYDLLALMTGSEGLLGVIVEVTVKLLPLPERAQVVLATFDEVAKASAAVGGIISAGIIPAGLEMMDHLAIRAAEDFVHAGYPRDAAAILLCELDGTNAEVSQQIYQVRKLLLDYGAVKIRTAQDKQERAKLWKGRKAAFPAVGRLAPDYYCMDGTIPRKRLPQVLGRITELSQEFNLPVANVFHAGDGNLHPLILYDANQPGELERAEQLGAQILELCVAVGGTITGEHGVGIEKINQMCVQFGTTELQQFHALKVAFDPKGLLNPGKAIPTLQRCAEFGAMHVHQGKLPFPELDRF
ncbi:FAD linked oxidase domain protein [Nitrosococcus halophilus Nc 4]|uniref:FAD linked oxidase domain protein n=1 Tax=Nitrosococcus halophilus (strain Nc4) TaxID=472759 RepID=D5BXE5_NITHN|nr:FAD-linked oxidase C-terminal domain-containing protein [Nitrosococcus halophilus]ADE15828.1 FAD linked oxidase domain protein [Nitrosococcus halophilus Nc 4]